MRNRMDLDERKMKLYVYSAIFAMTLLVMAAMVLRIFWFTVGVVCIMIGGGLSIAKIHGKWKA